MRKLLAVILFSCSSVLFAFEGIEVKILSKSIVLPGNCELQVPRPDSITYVCDFDGFSYIVGFNTPENVDVDFEESVLLMNEDRIAPNDTVNVVKNSKSFIENHTHYVSTAKFTEEQSNLPSYFYWYRVCNFETCLRVSSTNKLPIQLVVEQINEEMMELE